MNKSVCVFSLILILISSSLQGQEVGTYQADSIYKENNVKVRNWYRGTNKKGGTSTYYDKEGRLIKYKIELNFGSLTRTTHFLYDEFGKLVSQIDSLLNGKPSKKEMKRVKKMGLDPKLFIGNLGKPAVEVEKYELIYEGGQLIRKIKYNSDGSLDIVDNYKEGGGIQVREWYRDGSLYQESITEFITEFQKEKFYGWRLNPDGSKLEWEYKFVYDFDNGVVKSMTRFDGDQKKETVTYFYNGNGLLTKTEGYGGEVFEYEFY